MFSTKFLNIFFSEDYFSPSLTSTFCVTFTLTLTLIGALGCGGTVTWGAEVVVLGDDGDVVVGNVVIGEVNVVLVMDCVATITDSVTTTKLKF